MVWYNRMYILIWTVFSGEWCGPGAPRVYWIYLTATIFVTTFAWSFVNWSKYIDTQSNKSQTSIFHYGIEDMKTPHFWSCSVLIILTNQWLLLFDWKYFGSFDLLNCVDYMPEMTRKCNNKIFIICKNSAQCLK